MKLSFLYPTSKLATNITKFSRDFRLEIVTKTSVKISTLVVITNGTPDDLVFTIISHCLDGESTVGILKPEEGTRDSVINLIPTYLGPHTKNILLIMDQEIESLENLLEKCSRKLREKGCRNIREHGNRLNIYDCELGGKESKVILVINGLDEINTDSHCVEDHLIKFAEMKCKGSSKDSWEKLSKEEQNEIFKKLLDCREIEKIFPQQFKAGQILRSP